MKRVLSVILSLLCLCHLSALAQEDSLKANRYVVRSTLYGVGHTNILDTYLSPMEYSGMELRLLRESMPQVSVIIFSERHISIARVKIASNPVCCISIKRNIFILL